MNIFQMKRFPHGVDTYDEFLKQDIISIGWNLLGDLKSKSKKEIKALLKQHYSLEAHKLGNALGAIWCFYSRMSTGDIIIIRNKKKISVGIVDDYDFEPTNPIHLQHFRVVEWIEENEDLTHFNESIHKLVRTPGIVTGATFEISSINDIY